jgi:hypothetical protein
VKFAPLVPGTSYRASLVSPAPTIRPPGSGWTGAQFATYQRGAVRFEWAAFLWRHHPGGDIAIIGGPAMAMSAAEAIHWPRTQWAKRGAPWPYGPTRRWTVAGRSA